MNMSVAPQTIIRHLAGDRRSYGQGIIFRLPAYVKPLDIHHLWEMVTYPDQFPVVGHRLNNKKRNPRRCCLTDADADAYIRERLHLAAGELQLPPAAIVSDRYLKGDKVCKNILHILAVLSKSSDYVYLRKKEPNLANLLPGRKVVLIDPQPSVHLQKASK